MFLFLSYLRKHYVQFPPGVFDRHFEKLLDCEPRFSQMCQSFSQTYFPSNLQNMPTTTSNSCFSYNQTKMPTTTGDNQTRREINSFSQQQYHNSRNPTMSTSPGQVPFPSNLHNNMATNNRSFRSEINPNPLQIYPPSNLHNNMATINHSFRSEINPNPLQKYPSSRMSLFLGQGHNQLYQTIIGQPYLGFTSTSGTCQSLFFLFIIFCFTIFCEIFFISNFTRY